jgi:hypothetical protein
MIPKPLRSGLMSLLCAMTLFIATSETADAQDPRRGYGVGVGGAGTDMWTQAFSGLRLYTPHRDDCNATTEVFVKLYTNSNSVDFGYCIDKDEQAAQEWEDARQTCLDSSKRLPEPAEWKVACDIGTGLNNMTNAYEWAGNTNFFAWKPNGNLSQNWGALLMGNGTCKTAAHSGMASLYAASGSYAFRCVR